jgi:hypothetical protein
MMPRRTDYQRGPRGISSSVGERRRYIKGGQEAHTHPEACREQEVVEGSVLHPRLDDMSAEKFSSSWHLQA